MGAVSANETNTPNRTEQWWPTDGEKHVEVTEDTKIPNAATFRFPKQDHTLANMIRGHLLKNPSVLFAGYKHPHPLEPYFLLKVQTVASTTPVKVLQLTLGELVLLTQDIEEQWAAERSKAQMEGWAEGAGAGVGVGARQQGEGFGFGFGGGAGGEGGAVGGGGGGVYGGDMDF
ncbi:DNA-directed RNA polymerase [Mrakia frigida]|uniref:DNA-directed RNA polymerase II core subunit RPB11 n=1 Tax=Mrakia frigida TaxID=29902 RepID=UPI003FCC0586